MDMDYDYLAAVKKLNDGECEKIRPLGYGLVDYILDPNGALTLEACRPSGELGIYLPVNYFLGRWILIGEKKTKAEDNKIFSGPNSEKLWAEIRDLKDNPIKDILYSMGCKLQELEDKMLED